jgi:uncharacterized protein (TIGR03083 family)
MSEALAALHASVDRLHRIAAGLGPDQVRQSAYPTEWTVADVLSHIGSGAVIMRRGFEDRLAGRETPGDFNQSVWDEWNAKSPDDQAAEALMADAALLAALESATEAQLEGFEFTMGPMTLDVDGFVSLRLGEHAVHTWDIEVVLDADATLTPETVPVLVDRVPVIAGFAGRSPGTDTVVPIRTSLPERDLSVVTTPDSVQLVPSEPGSGAPLALPAEALIRLVYGRLDPEHTPSGVDGPVVEQLRLVFPGF